MADNLTQSQQAAHAHPHHAHHHRPNYMTIFYWLLVLTVAEVIAAVMPVGRSYPHFAKAILLVGMALSKALLVAMYFMHLKFEKRTLGMIAATPLVICIFLLFMLMPDLLWLWREV